MKEKFRIESSKDALERSIALPGVWSLESQLTQRILIYVAQLLERKNSPKRKQTAWQKHLGKALKQGKTPKQASVEYQARRNGK